MPKRTPTVRRSLISLVIASLLPTLIAAIAALLYAYAQEQGRFREGMKETTRALALVVDREIATREAIAQTLANSPALDGGDLATFYLYAGQVATTRDKVVVLHDLTGQQVVHSRVPFGSPLPLSQISDERKAAGPQATLVSNLYLAPVGGQYSFAVQVPVVRDGQTRYYLSVAGYASALQSIMTDQRLPPGWVASILDRKNVVVARNRAAEQFVGKPVNERLASQLGNHTEGGFESVSVDGTPVLATFSKSPTYGWTVVVGVPLAATPSALEAVAPFAALATLLLAFALLLAVWTGRRLLEPVERLRAASEDLGSGRAPDTAPTGLKEADQVLAGLQDASRRIARANAAEHARREEAEAAARALQISNVRLRESEERLLLLANTIPTLAWMADADGSISWYNDRWYDYTGTTPAEMAGWGWQSVHDPQALPHVMHNWTESVRTGEPFEMTFPLRGADGVFRPFFTRVAPLRGAQGQLLQWFGTNTDISPLKKAEDELREADRRKDEFLAMLAHELRNPLAPIRTAAELLRKLPDTPPPVLRASEIIARQVGHMSGLLNDLLDVSRVTRGLVTLERDRIDIAAVVASAVEQVRPLIAARRHNLRVQHRDHGAQVLASRLRLTQVIANLLDNAAKYCEPGGEIAVETCVEAGAVQVVVSDTGIGISAQLLPSIFEPFTQAERDDDRSQGGLGLGLAVVKGLVELHGGSVSAHSDGIDRGSRFTVVLPLVADAAVPQAATPVESAVGATTGLAVLVVDDNVDAADTLAVLLQALGHRATCVYTAQQAIALAGQQAFDVAILDIGLPDMSGHRLAGALRGGEHPIRTLFALSGYGQPHDRSASDAAGFQRHFVKPVEPDALLDALAQAIPQGGYFAAPSRAAAG